MGRLGEDMACKMLQDRGLKILDRNLRKGHKEIDIVCLEGTSLRFVEVKTRREPVEGEVWEAVTAAKMRNISRAAQHYLRSLPFTLRGVGGTVPVVEEVFFDIVTIVWDRKMERCSLEYIPDAFKILYF